MPERAKPFDSAYQNLSGTLLSPRSSVTMLPPSAAWLSFSSTYLIMLSMPLTTKAYNDHMLLSHTHDSSRMPGKPKEEIPFDDFESVI